ncbi:YciI family protein [Chitinophaga sp. 22620]|uniref:YciI family protein n=1 Tax=Chitinophaga sp. 22620 TaxID=3453952 RepID=UPI003F849EDB
MAKLMPVFLLAVFLTFVIASFSSRTLRFKSTESNPVAGIDAARQVEVKKYWMVFLETGPHHSQDPATRALIQEKHMAGIRKMAADGKLLAAGPFGGGDNLRGIFIMDCKDSLEAVSLINADTAVITGRLKYTIKPWWTVKNCLFR